MTYSLDFRRKALQIKIREGLTIQETANRFGVGRSTIERWLKNLEIRQKGVLRQGKIDKEALLLDVRNYPDAYLSERAKRFGVCNKAIWQALKKLGIRYKKNTHSSQSRRAGSYALPEQD